METIQVSHEERELIETLRNYRRAYPNGKEMFNKEIQALIKKLKDPSYRETISPQDQDD